MGFLFQCINMYIILWPNMKGNLVKFLEHLRQLTHKLKMFTLLIFTYQPQCLQIILLFESWVFIVYFLPRIESISRWIRCRQSRWNNKKNCITETSMKNTRNTDISVPFLLVNTLQNTVPIILKELWSKRSRFLLLNFAMHVLGQNIAMRYGSIIRDINCLYFLFKCIGWWHTEVIVIWYTNGIDINWSLKCIKSNKKRTWTHHLSSHGI